MALSSLQLQAFVQVSKLRSFSKAADSLFVTQSALSQRIKNLELDLGLTLFIRDNSGIDLTEAGIKLLRFCQVKDSLEEEFLHELQEEQEGELAGIVRIAGFSSIMRSVIMPALSEIRKKNPKVNFEFLISEMGELPGLLKRNEADFVVMDYELDKIGVKSHHLGDEEYVVIRSIVGEVKEDHFLDHDPMDTATEKFFSTQPKKIRPKSLTRSFMGDVYGIIDGVVLGYGNAVMSKHLVGDWKKIKLDDRYKPYRAPVTLHYYDQPFYTRLFQTVRQCLTQNCEKYLS